MDLELSAHHRALRDEIRGFFAEKLTPELRHAQRMLGNTNNASEISRAWLRILEPKGWGAPLWPKEFGGPGWTPFERFIYETEAARADAPVIYPQGIRYVGPLLIRYGTPQQRAFFLPRILSGEHYWCQGYSEPQAGSDLAALKTAAVRDGDSYVINGTKIWTTDAHEADWMFALVRTDASGRKQDGISLLFIDMKTPGISIRPILTIGGDHELNQVFFDDVRVPAENLVGEENKGWTYGKYILEFERGGTFIAGRLTRFLEQAREIADLSRPEIARRFVDLEIDIATMEMSELRLASALDSGESLGHFASMLKLRSSKIRQDLTKLAMDLMGEDALKWEARRPLRDIDDPLVSPEAVPFVSRHLNFRAWTIFAGTSEVQHEIVAKTRLGI